MRKLVTRTRLHAIGASAAFAFMVGLSAPAAAISESMATPSETAAVVEAAQPSLAEVAIDAVAEAGVPVAAAPAPAPQAPTGEQMHPLGVTAQQQTFTPSAEQIANAKAIVEAGKAMGLPPRAWVIAVATSLQESNLRNIGHLGASNDHDSLGLFQQRPSTGWGTPEQIQDPNYSATAFYKGLVEVPGWETLPLTAAAQKVQVSAYPDHYAKHETQAGNIVAALHGAGPYADIAASLG